MTEFQFPLTDPTSGKVICQICGKPFLVISPTHLKKHNIDSYDTYTSRFPGAPLSTDEFKKRGSVGRKVKGHRELFADEMNPIIKVDELTIDDIEPEIEEIDIEKIFEKDVPKDPIQSVKRKILDTLKMYYANVQENYLIYLRNPINDNIEKEYITDFADPILKIDFEFPDTFWHNKEWCPDNMRDFNLKQAGWKIIKIGSISPNNELIRNAIEENK